jgi:hypothetical protein
MSVSLHWCAADLAGSLGSHCQRACAGSLRREQLYHKMETLRAEEVKVRNDYYAYVHPMAGRGVKREACANCKEDAMAHFRERVRARRCTRGAVVERRVGCRTARRAAKDARQRRGRTRTSRRVRCRSAAMRYRQPARVASHRAV